MAHSLPIFHQRLESASRSLTKLRRCIGCNVPDSLETSLTPPPDPKSLVMSCEAHILGSTLQASLFWSEGEALPGLDRVSTQEQLQNGGSGQGRGTGVGRVVPPSVQYGHRAQGPVSTCGILSTLWNVLPPPPLQQWSRSGTYRMLILVYREVPKVMALESQKPIRGL